MALENTFPSQQDAVASNSQNPRNPVPGKPICFPRMPVQGIIMGGVKNISAEKHGKGVLSPVTHLILAKLNLSGAPWNLSPTNVSLEVLIYQLFFFFLF